MRRFIALAMLVALALLAVAPDAAAPHRGGTRLSGQAVVLWGGVPGGTGEMTFTAEPFDPTLIFFRFDMDANGTWDYPDQTGAGALGRWTTLDSLTKVYFQPFVRACVQAWDGTSTRVVGGVVIPRGPIGCTDYVDAFPDHWNQGGAGRFVLLHFEIPTWLAKGDFNPRYAEVEGLSARLWPPNRPEWNPGHWWFFVDRVELTRLLGPGTHTVHLTLAWAGATFSGADEVTIR